MKNILLIGQCSFKINMDGTMKYPGGTEKVNDSLIRVIGGSGNYHLYYLHHNGSKTPVVPISTARWTSLRQKP